jgi:uncharacterized membrane protein
MSAPLFPSRNMNKKSLLVLEIVWIIVGVLSIAAGINYSIKTGGTKVYVFFLMALVSFVFGLIRHNQRKKS